MSRKLRPLVLRLEAVDKLTASLDRISRKVNGLTGPVHRLHGGFARLGRATGLTRLSATLGSITRRVGLLSGALAGLGVFGFRKFVAGAGEVIESAKRIGISAERLQGIRWFGKQNEFSQQTLNRGLLELSKRQGQARAGQGAMYKALQKTNPALAEQFRHINDVGEAFDLAVATMDRAKTAAGRQRLASIFFGGAGKSLSSLTESGLRAAEDEARQVGAVLGDSVLEQMDVIDDRIVKFGAIAGGFAKGVGKGLLSSVDQMT